MPTLPAPTNTASDKQTAFIARLLGEREGVPEAEAIGEEGRTLWREGRLTGGREGTASALITRLLAVPKPTVRPELADEPEAGAYRTADGTVYRVYHGQQSGRMLAAKAVTDGERWEFQYQGLASRYVAGAERLSLEEAKAWGKNTETCCICGRRLDVPESVDAGIGPKCARSFR